MSHKHPDFVNKFSKDLITCMKSLSFTEISSAQTFSLENRASSKLPILALPNKSKSSPIKTSPNYAPLSRALLTTWHLKSLKDQVTIKAQIFGALDAH